MKAFLRALLHTFSIRPSRRNFKLICAVMGLITVYYSYLVYRDRIFHLYLHESYESPCEIPEVDPYDPEMMKYVWRPAPLECHKKPTPVVYVDANNILQFNISALNELRETETSVHCSYQFINRLKEDLKADEDIEFSDPVPFTPPTDIQADFFRVTCKGKRDKTLFDNTLTKIVKANKKFGKVDPNTDRYNVLLFGMDSVSRASAIRQLPNSFEYLTRELDAFDFRGYTKVADNTFVNIIPLLTGYIAYSNETPTIDFLKEYIDGFPFIWKNFSAQGYATIFVEDLPNLGMFNLEKLGFKDLPTDHFMRPYWLANYQLRPIRAVNHYLRALQNRNVQIASSSALCDGNIPNHVTQINYLKQFMMTYKHERKFMFSFMTELAHEFQNLLNLGDNDIRDFFKWMKENGFLDDTILIVFSDHGLKFGNNQHLFSARLESRLPWLNIVLPLSLRKKYPKLLHGVRTNQNRLLSTFDIHATLRDVLNASFENPTTFWVNNSVRGISLFQELSKDRSCKDANIGKSYCACYKSEPVNVTGNHVIQTMAAKTVEHINNIIKRTPECVPLKLNATISARKISQGLKQEGVLRKHNMWINFHLPKAEERDDTKYVLVLTTTPGGGKFFATCSYNSATGHAEVLGNIDRTNRYGDQPHCIHDTPIKPFCVCKDMVGVTYE